MFLMIYSVSDQNYNPFVIFKEFSFLSFVKRNWSFTCGIPAFCIGVWALFHF